MKIEIIPFVGYGQIKFGQSIEQVKLLLGEPTDSTREKHDDGTEDITLLYGEQGVELSFMSEDDFRLGLISCYSPNFTLDGIAYTGMSELDFLKTAKYDDINLEDDFSELKAKDYTIDSKGLSVWVQEGYVNSITLFPQYTADDEDIIWPE